MRKYPVGRLQRRGATAIIAMLYLVLFSSLAVGFAAATQTAVQVAYNEDRAQRAMLAAESGMDFVRYHLYQLNVDRKTKPDKLMGVVFTQLGNMMNGSPNLGGKSIAFVNGEILIPGPSDPWVPVNDDLGKFRAVLSQIVDTPDVKQGIRVRVTASHKDYTANARGIQMDYAITEKPSSVFGFGVAARGPVITGGSSRIRGDTDPARGSVLSASSDAIPVNIGGKEVSGDVSITNPNGTVRTSHNAIGGTVHKGVDEPEFPTIDADVFLPYVKNTYTGGKNGTTESIRIPAGTNPTFAAGTTLSGVIYVETPNTLTFRGHSTVNGIIVVENNPKGNPNTNVLDFAGNVSVGSVKDLKASDVPSLSAAELSELRKMTGSFILAHGFSAKFTGSFGTVGGSILADQISMTGNAGGQINGSVVGLTPAPLTLNGSSEVRIGEPWPGRPAGVFFGRNYVPVAATYEEFRP